MSTPASQVLDISEPLPGSVFFPDIKDHVENLHARAPILLTAVGGTASAFTATATPTPAALVAGMAFHFVPNANCSANATLNVSTLGAKNLADEAGSNVLADELVSGSEYTVVYDGTKLRVVGIRRVAVAPAAADRSTRVPTSSWVGDEIDTAALALEAEIDAIPQPRPIPYEPSLGSATTPILNSGKQVVGGWTEDGGVLARSGVRGSPVADDPDVAIESGDLVVTQGGDIDTIDGSVYAFKSARVNGMSIVVTRLNLPWPSARARQEGVFQRTLWLIDQGIVIGVQGWGQSTMAGTKGFVSGSTIEPDYAEPSGYGRVVMHKRKALNTDERGTYNRLNASSYQPWVESDFEGVEEFFAYGGPGNVHGQSPLDSFVRGMETNAIADIGRAPMVHLANFGVGGLTIALLKKNPTGTGNITSSDNPYADAMLSVQMAYDYWDAQGLKYFVGFCMLHQGEANDTSGDGTTWQTDLQSIISNSTTDIANITAQPNPPIWMAWQTTTCRDESIGRGFLSTLGQMKAHIDGDIVLVAPGYAVRVNSGMANDYQHFNSVGYTHLGDYAARAHFYYMRDGYYEPMRIDRANANLTGASVVLPYLGSDMVDLAVDTVLMSDPGQSGYRVFDEGNSNTEISVSSVSRSAAGQITLALGSTPVGPVTVDVALKGYTTAFATTNPNGYVESEQMRACVRSTNTFEASDGTNLYHWVCAERVTGIS